MSARTPVSRAHARVICLALLPLSIVACRGDSPSNDASRLGNDAEMTAPTNGQAVASRGEERLRTRNQQEWIGIAHNKMLDDFRKDLRKPGTLTNNICEYVASFSMSDARMPAGAVRGPDGNWRAVQAVADSSRSCSSTAKFTLSGFSLEAPYSAVAPRNAQAPSAEAYALLAEIETAISVAPDGRDLANRLNNVLTRAQSLPDLDRVVIEATISVAQNSFVYWSAQYALFEEEMIAEYSPCIEQQMSLGATDGIVDTCYTGKGAGGAVAASPDGKVSSLRLIRTRARRVCGPSLREGFRHIGYADAKGAFTGGFAGGLAGGLAGAVGGALAGGGANSIWAAGENAWKTLKCMYGMT
jgi:hypothetical protein